MSFSPDLSSTSRLSERLTAASVQELTSLILRTEDPVCSTEVVASLLELLVGGPGAAKDNYIVKEPSVLLLLFNLLPHCSESLQLEVWSKLSLLLRQSQSNLHVCRPLRLLERCLDSLRRTSSDKVANLVVQVLETVGSYHISLKELQSILSYLYTGQNQTWAPHSTTLLGALSTMAAAVQPDVFFSFSGAPGAALTLPPFTKWPTLSGFTLNTWIRLERLSDVKNGSYKPTIYWFRTGRPELGYSAHLTGSTLVIETISKSKKLQSHKVKFTFQPYQWYMLTVIYVYSRMRSCQLFCYVNGEPVLGVDHVILPATDDAFFDKCFLGSSPASTRDVVFQGQMSAVYLFKEPLGRDVAQALHKLGPAYKVTMRIQ